MDSKGDDKIEMFNAAPTQPKADIKIFGSYCHRCQVFNQAVEQIVQELATEAQIECLSEISDFEKYNVLYLPALWVNGKLLFQGGVPSAKKLKAILEKALTLNDGSTKKF